MLRLQVRLNYMLIFLWQNFVWPTLLSFKVWVINLGSTTLYQPSWLPPSQFQSPSLFLVWYHPLFWSLVFSHDVSLHYIFFMYSSFGNHCTNFIDDFGKAEIQEQSYDAFCAFGTLLAVPGLDSSPEKESLPATSMVFLGILVHTKNMTVSITPDCLQELYHHCSFLSVDKVSCTDLQSLLWVMSFVNACVTCTAHTPSFKITLKWHSLSQIHLFFEFKCFPWYFQKI